MEKHFDLTDHEFETQFADRSLEPSLFTHEAHLRLAWIHINRYGVEAAIDNICQQINAFATAHGDHDKFHKTVTVAAVRAVYHFILKSESGDFADFIAEHPRLKSSFKQLIDAHYGIDIFKSEQARKEFIEPDLLPFDQIPSDKDHSQ